MKGRSETRWQLTVNSRNDDHFAVNPRRGGVPYNTVVVAVALIATAVLLSVLVWLIIDVRQNSQPLSSSLGSDL